MLLQLPVSAILLDAIAAAAALIYAPYLVVAYGPLQVGYDLSGLTAIIDKFLAYASCCLLVVFY